MINSDDKLLYRKDPKKLSDGIAGRTKSELGRASRAIHGADHVPPIRCSRVRSGLAPQDGGYL